MESVPVVQEPGPGVAAAIDEFEKKEFEAAGADSIPDRPTVREVDSPTVTAASSMGQPEPVPSTASGLDGKPATTSAPSSMTESLMGSAQVAAAKASELTRNVANMAASGVGAVTSRATSTGISEEPTAVPARAPAVPDHLETMEETGPAPTMQMRGTQCPAQPRLQNRD